MRVTVIMLSRSDRVVETTSPLSLLVVGLAKP
jgi:hypothetical protein